MNIHPPPFWGQVTNAYPTLEYAPKDFAQEIPVPENAQSLFSVAKAKEGDEFLGPRHDSSKLLSLEVSEKAEYLIWKFPEIANAIKSPIQHWSGIYDYFDVADVTSDGAFHLHNAIGLIATVNATKDTEILKKTTSWAHQNKEKVMAGLPLVPSELRLLGIRESDIERYQEVLALTLNLLAGQFSFQEKVKVAEAAEVVRKACFLNPPICSSSRKAPKITPHQPINLQGQIVPSENNNSRRRDLAGTGHAHQSSGSSQVAINKKHVVHAGQHHLTDAGASVFHASHIHGAQATGHRDGHRASRHVAQMGQNIEIPGLNAPPIFMFNPQLPSSMIPQCGPPIYQLVKSPPQGSAPPGRQPLANLRLAHSSQYPWKELYNPNSNSTLQNDAKMLRAGRSGSQSKGVPLESNDARVYYGGQIGSRNINPQAPFNVARVPDNRPRTFSNTSGRGPENQRQQDANSATLWVAGHENLQDPANFLKSLFSNCGEVIGVTPISPKGGGSPFAFIEFTNSASASLAIQRFDGYRLDEGRRSLTVRPRVPKDPNSKGRLSMSHNSSHISLSEKPLRRESPERQDHRGSSGPTSAGSMSQRQFRYQIPPDHQYSRGQPSREGSARVCLDTPPKNAALTGTKKEGPTLNTVDDWVTSQSRNSPDRKIKDKRSDQSHSRVPENRSDNIPVKENSENTSPTKKRLDSTSSSTDSSTLVGSVSESGTNATSGVTLPKRQNLFRSNSGSPDILEPIAELPSGPEVQNSTVAAEAINDSKHSTKSWTGSEVTALVLDEVGESTPSKVQPLSATSLAMPQKKKKKSSKSKNKNLQRQPQTMDSTSAIGEVEPSRKFEKTGSFGVRQKNESTNTEPGSSATSFCDASSSDPSPSKITSGIGLSAKKITNCSSLRTASHEKQVSDPKSEHGSQARKTNSSTTPAVTHRGQTTGGAANPSSALVKVASSSPKSSEKKTTTWVARPLIVEQASRKPTTPKHKKDLSGSSAGSSTKNGGSTEKKLRESHKSASVNGHSPSPASKLLDKQSNTVNRKENEPLASPIDVLSDLSQWPALGSSQSSFDAKTRTQVVPALQPLAECQSLSNRRHSMASVVSLSGPSQQHARCELDCSKVSSSFPKITRWVQHGASQNAN